MIWDVKTRENVVYRTAYRGDHYKETEAGDIGLFRALHQRSRLGTSRRPAGSLFRGNVGSRLRDPGGRFLDRRGSG